MAKRHGEHNSMSDVLKDFVHENKLDKGMKKVQAEQAWRTLMGTAISKYTSRVVLDRGTLYISLESSVLREELSYGKQKIIQLLNEELGDDTIQKVVLR